MAAEKTLHRITQTEKLRLELAEKNRALKVEKALDAVRAVALKMNEPADMLKICKAISLQLAKLGVKEIRNVQTAIFYPQRGTYINYEYYAKHYKTFITDVEYKNHKIQVAFARKMMKGANEKVVEHLKGEKLKDWYNYQKTTNQFADKYILTAHSLNYYWYSLGPVALGISTYAPLNKEELDLFQRFMKVFELAYRRYLDIEQAAAQAREAQIEAALERIRARALAMHSSDELTDVAKLLREQMGALGQRELETSAVHLYDEDAAFILSWRAFRLSSDLQGGITYGFFKIPKNSCDIVKEFIQKFRSKSTDYTIEVSGARQAEWYKILFKLAPEVSAAMKKSGATREKRYYHFSKFSGGALLMVSSQEPSGDVIELQRRAAQVFDLAYRRFKDLQKAEAQAREAQIEAALERIRAASLAMQNSSALGQIIYTLYGELTKLDAKLDRCFIMIVNPDNKGITWWMAGHEGLLAENGFFVQMNQHPSHLMYLDYCRKRKKKWTYLFEGKEKRDWDRFGFSKTALAKLPESIKAFMAAQKKVHLSGSSDQFGSLVTGSFEPLPEEQQEIISRFAIAFNQAYIRFLDLQKAEAQAREAQIQLALERVRARTMAMQHSEELAEVSYLLNKQVVELGIPTRGCAFNIYNEHDSTEWFSNLDGTLPAYRTPRENVFLEYYNAGKRGETLLIEEYSKERIRQHYKYLYSLGYFGNANSETVTLAKVMPDSQVDHVAYFKYGYLLFITLAPAPEAHDIFMRFAKEFEQTYTRFLDLQKAEAQAREAQIEAALERVRSRSMAMHKSEELKEVIRLVLDQFIHLNINAEHAGFYIDYKAHDDMHIWLADPNIEPYFAVLPYFDTPTWNSFLESKAKGIAFHTDLLDFKEKNKFYRSLFKLFEIPEEAKRFYLKCKGLAVSTVLLDNVGLYIENFQGIPYAEEENKILMRFGKVFQQTYTRFLDLQKAEAQAREAQVEAALENIRSRSLAMHNSSELKEVVKRLFEKLKELGFFHNNSVMIVLPKNGFDDVIHWTYNEGFENSEYHVPFIDHPVGYGVSKAWKNGEKTFEITIDKAAKNRFCDQLFSKTDYARVPDAFKEHLYSTEGYSLFLVFEKHCALLVDTFTTVTYTEYQKEIVRRFANVFEQAYIRFLDLQKAEAQAKEAEIQLALERVRARAMAMQKSDELAEAATILFQQVKALGIETYTSGFTIWDNDDNDLVSWMCNADGSVNPPFRMPALQNEWHRQQYESWKRGDECIVHDFAGEEMQEHYAYLRSFPLLDEAFKKSEAAGVPTPERQVHHAFNFAQGNLLFITLQPLPEAYPIFKRFASTFEQTYIRFLDLQKAEAQAREAEIELALERVRARTMAMQRSEELADAAQLLFHQVEELGVDTWTSGFQLWDEDRKSVTVWTSTKGVILPPFKVPITSDPLMKHIAEAAEREDPLYVEAMGGEALEAHYRFMLSLPTLQEIFGKIAVEGHRLPTFQVNHAAYFSYGYLLFITHEQVPAMHDIFKRFAKVFEGTYTRFLDLKKAEAQAREAQIEAALERVRSRTMGMQKSTELNEVAFVLFEQIRLLGGKLWGTGFALCNAQDAHDEFWFANEMGVMPPVSIPNTEDDVHVAMLQGWKEHKDYLSSQKEGEALAAHYRYLYSLPQMKAFFDPMLMAGFEFPTWQQWHAAYFSKGYLLIITTEPYAEPDIFIRFAKVFDQTYTRFLDLQRAEAQAREARIEAALEKVRSRTMAMQKSGDLNGAAADMFKEIQALGMQPWGCGFNIFDSDEKAVTQYMSLADGGISPPFRTPLTDDPLFIEIYNARQRRDELLVMESAGESLAETYRYMFGLPGSGEIFGDLLNAGFEMPKYQITHCAYFSQGYLVFITYQQVTEAHDIFKRFAKVFDQTYTRFLDLQKAEAQAREAQIEAALERVRAKAMAMHTSQELSDVVHELRMQMGRLGQKDLDTCVIHLHDESPDFISAWAAMKTPESEEGILEASAQVPKRGLLIIEEALQAYAANKGEYVIVNEGEKISQWMTFLQQVSPAAFEKLQESIDHLPQKEVRSYWSFADFSGGALLIVTTDPPIEETRQLLRRFSNVFGLAYRRFSDIKHAEAQAREAQIEAALERVRSRSMAMHDSKELGEVAKVMFNQMKLLGGELFAFGIVLCDKNESVVQQWHGLGEGDMMTPFQVPVDLDYIHRYRYDQWKAGVELFSIEIPSDYIARHFELMFALPSVKMVMDDLKSKGIELAHPSWEIDYGASFRYGYLLVSSLQPYEEDKIFPRFAKVFEQAYTRFLDLQKAEAQAREAQIEAALERVRSKAMAMHNSSDLPSTAIIAFSELKKLGFVPIRGGISIQNKENRKNLLYSATSSAEGDNLSLVGWAMLDNHPVLAEIYNQWMKGEDYFPELRGDLLKTYYEQVRTSFAVPVEQTDVEQFGYFMYFTHGVFYGWCAKPVLDEEKKLLRRFAAVIDLTFKRYFDLQKSEAQAREAQIEAALEKVRSRTLAMQKSDELAGTAAVLFQQLISLGIEPNRLYIILIKDNTADMEAWVTDEDGSKVSMGFTGSYQKNGTLLKMYEGWRAKRKTLVIDMQGEELQQYFHYLHDELNVPFKGGMEQKRRVQHIAYFSHGLIGMASPDEQPIETLELLERFAYVFNLTFTRFNDLQVAEAHALQAEQDLIAIKEAKQKAEQALKELQATQNQLIQAEKMASLGELTAGIAHEIQNPLNFVNNFSEVSKELLEEMREAIEKGDNAEAREIMEDVIRNLEKINHHGKRADGIVKGMLQHSRSSSGQKELTDINALCDEYLRLAYHGLRAKDKSFNAHFETKLDPEIGWVEIVPQEIGRVILNLINNAFYAVNARRKAEASGYVPTVQVVTSKQQDKIEIRVADNGTGIPASVKEKIFQPFFTTKPTGQGTGLGLSLSYDIVKAHGGELRVESKENEGSEFIIRLPG